MPKWPRRPANARVKQESVGNVLLCAVLRASTGRGGLQSRGVSAAIAMRSSPVKRAWLVSKAARIKYKSKRPRQGGAPSNACKDS